MAEVIRINKEHTTNIPPQHQQQRTPGQPTAKTKCKTATQTELFAASPRKKNAFGTAHIKLVSVFAQLFFTARDSIIK